LAVSGIVFWMLIRRHSPNQVLLGSATLLVAFFVLPTRVHERYLVQAFAILAIVWAAKNSRRLLLALLAVANTLNLHAILAADLSVQTVSATASPVASGLDLVGVARNVVTIISGNPPEYYAIGWVRMDATFARTEWVIWAVIFIHLAALLVILFDFLKANGLKLFDRKAIA